MRPSWTLLVGFLVLTLASGIHCKKEDSGPTDNGGGGGGGGGNGTAMVTGIVKDADSASTPIAGAAVRIGTGTPVTTSATGEFSIGVTPATTVTLSITKSGYSLNEVVVNVPGGTTRNVTVGLLRIGATVNVPVSSGGSVADGGYTFSMPANFVSAAGNVSVSVTGLDPTTNEIRALPGGLEAIDATGATKYLQPVSFAEYSVRDASGNILQVNPSATSGATIELPLPASLAGQPGYRVNDPIECYLYDPSDGKWKTPVPGRIDYSTVNPSNLAIKATIFHLSWYGGAPATNDRACVTGFVRNADGSPAANVDVEGFAGGTTTTNAQGMYTVDAAPNSNVRVVATAVQGTTVRAGEVTVFTTGARDSCFRAPDITLGAPQPGLFSVTAVLYSFAAGGFGLDFVSIDINLTTPGGATTEFNDATVKIGTGGTMVNVPADNQAGGYHLTSPEITLLPGHLYDLTIDVDGNGTIDANGQVLMVGRNTITSPQQGETVGRTFTATWMDSGATQPGYGASYWLTIFGDSSSYFFLTNNKSKVVGNGMVDSSFFYYPQPNDPLTAGDYTMSLWGLNGPAGFLTIGNPQPNINGQGVSGYLYSYSFGESVQFSSNGTNAGRHPVARRKVPQAFTQFYERLPLSIRKRLDGRFAAVASGHSR